MNGNGDFSIGSKVWPGTSKLLEETGELTQVLGKLMGSHGDPAHYDGSDLRRRLVEEVADVQAAIAFFQLNNMDDAERKDVWNRTTQKLQLFEKWQQEGK